MWYNGNMSDKETEILKLKVEIDSPFNDGWTKELYKKQLAELQSK